MINVSKRNVHLELTRQILLMCTTALILLSKSTFRTLYNNLVNSSLVHQENMVFLVLHVRQSPVRLTTSYIDEADDVGKAANTMVILVHDYLEKYSYKEPHLLLHADNCVGQNNT